MSDKFKTVVTTQGLELLNQAIANEKDLNTQIRKYLELDEKVQELYTLQNDLE